MIAVSACLLGCNCRYDGQNKRNNFIFELSKKESVLPVCPEVLGGLSVPRKPSRITGGDGFDVLDGNAEVINIHGTDNTKAFIGGAYAALKMFKENGIERCILKDKSPS
ncbi:hypothetical protein BuS5_03775 [Desulfosarcina sp. BuS5]|uniref:DUF523 domain-containing protein n=1 Tax=Desulfosarcina sp. BuS5 TaxID=933262 RepID=UPI0005596274